MKYRTIFATVAFLLFAVWPAFGWTNPMVLPGLDNRSLGDPYIMKYRGYYYLYVSAGDEKIYCWRSKDLVDWSDAMVCGTDPVTAVAYAPEVTYSNGRFYMVTSPRGGGHYVLTSDSPTGPFVHRTDNQGRDIDGSIFIDDDGQWYFYHANNEGIRGCSVQSHLYFDDDVDLDCCMTGQWTEGPCVFKRNGLYYLVYTGNHVWTNGYRIDYAVSPSGPLDGFRPVKSQNPILIDAETPWHKALGHGTVFVGPDLDTYFFCYHNLQDNKRRRLLNFERIGWNGDKLIMTGPTYWAQDKPKVAVNDFFERSELGTSWKIVGGGKWKIVDNDYLSQTISAGRRIALFKDVQSESYTAEFTVRAPSTGHGYVGAVFSYKDNKNYSEALIKADEKTFVVRSYVDGRLCWNKDFPMPEDFIPAAWHHIRVEKSADKLKVFIDGMLKCDMETSLPKGMVGYVTDNCPGDFSYIAVSPYTDGVGMRNVGIPVPGILPVNLFSEKSGNVSEMPYEMPVGKSFFLHCDPGSEVSYKINVAEDAPYILGIGYQSGGALLQLCCDGEIVADSIVLPPSEAMPSVRIVDGIRLKGGAGNMTIKVLEGPVDLYEYSFRRGMDARRAMADDFNNGLSSDWGYREGEWNVADGQLESSGRYGKMLMGGYDDIPMTDYIVECDIIYPTGEMNGGLIFRTTNPSIGGADDNPVLGTDFLQGYSLIADEKSLTLGKHNYGWQPLATASVDVDPNLIHHMKIELEGATIRCYLDDMDTPLITYFDSSPFISGRAGVRAHNSVVRFDNFKITPR